jgi:GntR family transcriptional regulator, rspAB operon transcriptional repressor
VKSSVEHLDDIEPLGRSSVEQRAAQALRELIVSGRLPAGTPLVQRDLAERLGISQTPIRHALIELERTGLVEVGGTGRALVRRLTREDLEELYAVRLGLEGLAARLGAEAVGEPELERMREVLARLDQLARAQEIDPYLEGRWELHSTAYLASGRTRLVAEVERLFWRGERYHRLVLSSADRFARSVGSYHDFVEACEAHDGERAERVIHESLRWGVDLIAGSLPSEHDA